MQGCRFEFLSVVLITSLFGWLYNTCVLVPWKRESEFLKATLISAALNVALNLVPDPVLQGERGGLYDAAGRELGPWGVCIHYSKGGGGFGVWGSLA